MIAEKKKCSRCEAWVIAVHKVGLDGQYSPGGHPLNPIYLCSECYEDETNPPETLEPCLRGAVELRMMEARKRWSKDDCRLVGAGSHTTSREFVSIDGGYFRHGRLPQDDDEPMQRCGLCVVNPE